jgi:hypothetical protein
MRVFKIVCNQFPSEIKEDDVLLSLLRVAVVSELHITIGELPEFLGEMEPGLESIGVVVLFEAGLHEVYDSFPELIDLLCKLK